MPKKSRNGCKSFLILRKFSRRTCFPLFSSCTWELMKSFNIYKQSNWVYTFTTSRCEPWSGWIPQAFLSYNVYYFRKVTRSMTWFIFFISLPNFEYHILNQLNHKSSVWNIHKPLQRKHTKVFSRAQIWKIELSERNPKYNQRDLSGNQETMRGNTWS